MLHLLLLASCVCTSAIFTVRTRAVEREGHYVLTKADNAAIGAYLAIVDNADDLEQATKMAQLWQRSATYQFERATKVGGKEKELPTEVIRQIYAAAENPSRPSCPWAATVKKVIAGYEGRAGLQRPDYDTVTAAIEKVLGKKLPPDPTGALGTAREICTFIFDDMIEAGNVWVITQEKVESRVNAIGSTVFGWTADKTKEWVRVLMEVAEANQQSATCPWAGKCMPFAQNSEIQADIQKFEEQGWALDGGVIKSILQETERERSSAGGATDFEEETLGAFLTIVDNAEDQSQALEMADKWAAQQAFEPQPRAVVEKLYRRGQSCPWAAVVKEVLGTFKQQQRPDFAAVSRAVEDVLGRKIPEDPTGVMGAARTVCTLILDDMQENDRWVVTPDKIRARVNAVGGTIRGWTESAARTWVAQLEAITTVPQECPWAPKCLAFASNLIIQSQIDSFEPAGKWEPDAQAIAAALE